MISGHGTIDTAVAAIKAGAYDFIEKPFKADRLLLVVQRAVETGGFLDGRGGDCPYRRHRRGLRRCGQR